jgi:hypothetical protein
MRAVSKVVPVVLIVVVIVAALGIYFSLFYNKGGKTTTTPPSPSSGNLNLVPVLFQEHIANISARNIQGIMQQYSSNSLVIWEGNAQGLGGTYSGYGNINLLYDKAIGSASTFNMKILSYSQRNISSSEAEVNSSVSMTGKSTYLGNMSATISIAAVYEYTSSGWQISNETWNFLSFSVSQTGGATTFPEWQRVGPPNPSFNGPDVVHNIAWIVGPGLAAFLYALILSVAVLVVVKRVWKR